MDSAAWVIEQALDFLCADPRKQERYAWAAGAEEALGVLLEVVFELKEPRPALEELLRLACALELELRSPAAAATLLAVLAADPRVRALNDRGAGEHRRSL